MNIIRIFKQFPTQGCGYNKAHKLLKHYIINHQSGYVNGEIHTNTIESFWVIAKRGIIGQYHKVSVKHLDKYLDEFALDIEFARKTETLFLVMY